MTERILRARFEGDISGLKRMAAEGRQEIASVADAQEKASREMVSATEQSERKMAATVQIGTQRRIASIQREVNEAIQAIEKLPIAREEKERQIARIVETNAKRTSEILLQEIRKQEHAHQQVSNGMGSQSEAAIALTRNITGLVAAYVSLQSIIGMAGKGLSGNADLQQAGLTFEVLFKDADRAKAKIEELYGFAAKTPFEFAPVKDAALALETFGLNSSVYLRDAGDLAAAFGAEISEVARVFGRINSGDFGEAFERLRDFGISRELLEGEGLVFDKSGSYQGSVDQALTAVQNIIRTKFGGMMERQSGIFNGQMSNLADNFQTILNSVMAPTFDTLTGAVTELNTALDGAFGDEMQANIRVLGDIVNGVAVASLALGKAISETLDEMMAPLRWVRDTAASLGRGAGERDVAKSLVLSSGINPNRAQHYANLVGRGENLQNIARDFRVNSWGDPRGVQEDLGRLAVILADAKQIVNGTKQYQNFEPFGPPLPAGGVNPRTTNTSATSKPLEGHQLFAAQHKAGDLSDEQYLAKLNVELGKVVKNSSDYFAIREKIAGLKSDPWLDRVLEQSPGALDLRLGQLMQGDLSGNLPITSLDARIGSAFETPSGMLGLGNPGESKDAKEYLKLMEGWDKQNEKERKEELEKASKALLKIQEDAEKSLRTGLEAGISAFLDGGIQGLGTSVYSLSKDKFGKALADGLYDNKEIQAALGEIGEKFGDVFKDAPELGLAIDDIGSKVSGAISKGLSSGSFAVAGTIGIGLAAMFSAEIEKGLKLQATRKSIVESLGAPKSEAQRNLEWLQKRNAELSGNLDNPFIRAVSGAHVGGWESEKVANDGLIDSLNARIAAEKMATDAAYATAMALQVVSDRGERIGNAVSSTELLLKLGGVEAGTAGYENAIFHAYQSGLGSAGFTGEEAARLVGDRELQRNVVWQYQDWAANGFMDFGSGRDQMGVLSDLIGLNFDNSEALRTFIESSLMPMFSRLADLNPATSSVGNLNNPDTALQFDAPQTRNITNNNQFIVQSQAFMGSRADAREFAMMIWAELREIEGQSV